jgi:putative transposase
VLADGASCSLHRIERLMRANALRARPRRRGLLKDKDERSIAAVAPNALKTEWIAKKVYRTRDDARADVFDYIEGFCNTVRRHSMIGYVSPVEFERKLGLA